MKLTHQKLKSIVKEELKFILKENNESVQNLSVPCPECNGSGMVWEERWDGGVDSYQCPYCEDVGEDKNKIKVLNRYMKILELDAGTLRARIAKDKQAVVSEIRELAQSYVDELRKNSNRSSPGSTAAVEGQFKRNLSTKGAKKPEEDYGI